jgi:outer membrane protein assembly factor BamB
MRRSAALLAALVLAPSLSWSFGFGLGGAASRKVAKTVAKSTQTVNAPPPQSGQGPGNPFWQGPPPVDEPSVYLKWAYVGEPVLYSSPAMAPDGTIYFGTGGHFVYYNSFWRQNQKPPHKPYGMFAYTQDGRQKWRYGAGDDMPSRGGAAVGPDGTIYMVFEKMTDKQNETLEEMHAVNPDGTKKWSVVVSSWYMEIGNITPSIGADGTIYVAGRATKAIDPVDGHIIWEHANGPTGTNNFFGSPAIGADGTIYTVMWSTGPPWGQNVRAINPDNTVKWTSENLGTYPIMCSPSVAADGTVYLGFHDTEGLSGARNGAVIALGTHGETKWVFPALDFDVRSQPSIAADGTIYFGTKGQSGYVFALNPDGTQKWKYGTTGDNGCPNCGTDVYNTPVIAADGTVYAMSEFNFLYAFNPDGSVKWKDNNLLVDHGGGGESSGLLGPDGTLYLGTINGAFFAVHTGGPGPSATAQWGKFHSDAANTARRR